MCRRLLLRGIAFKAARVTYLPTQFGNASALYSKLLAEGILVRDCTSYGLPSHIRVAIKSQAEMEKFIDKLKTILKCKHAKG